ncbi:DMT family transporter [Microvirga terrestris]|uniref:DMT family transporter n=1 Tax=Microvirga terrestris TaxID=2791024 RepID=A0ABS0HSP5_9HYPH|nr:DMT family transporter [Microvirga terrestris]MBF9196496.1 DMT family transporter [Microvirga terrestris]
MALRDLFLMFLVCFLWAAHTIVSKIVVSGMEIPPLFYAAVRFGIVAVLALPWLLPAPRPRWRILLVGFLMGGGGFALFFLGIRSASPSSAAVVSQLGIPITALLSLLVLRERIDGRRALGIVLTFAGGVLVMWDPDGGFPLSAGLLLVLASTAVGSLAAVMMKQIEGVKPLQFQAWIGLASVMPMILLTTTLESGQADKVMAGGWNFVAALLFSALVVSLIAHTIYYGLIRKYPANIIAPLLIMNPLLTVALGILVTGDRFDARMAVGTGLALCGVLIIVLRRNHLMRLTSVLRGRFR